MPSLRSALLALAAAIPLAALPPAAVPLAATPAAASGGPGAVQVAQGQPGTAQTIAALEQYLRSVDTLVSRFTQVSSDGGYSQGKLWLDRPGKMRFEYDDPVPVLLIANGLELLYYDRELEQPTYVPLWETPLWMVLKEDATLSDGIEVMGLRTTEQEIEVRVREADHPERGDLVLRFHRNPLQPRRPAVGRPGRRRPLRIPRPAQRRPGRPAELGRPAAPADALRGPRPGARLFRMRLILHLLGWLFVFAGLVVFARDLWIWLTLDRLSLAPIGNIWNSIHSSSLQLLQAGVERNVAPWLWWDVIFPIVLAPAAPVLAAIGLLLVVLTRRRKPPPAKKKRMFG
jgi:hypothetical protein